MKKSIWPILSLLLVSCTDAQSLSLAPGWHSQTVAEWGDARPDMLVIANQGNTLYLSFENKANQLAPSLGRIDLSSGKTAILLYGMDRADGLKMDKQGQLWLGEESTQGQIWTLAQPDLLPAEQRLDRMRRIASHPSLKMITQAGLMAHEGLSFSQDGHFLYLLDEWQEGCLYRFDLARQQLAVFHDTLGWRLVSTPEEARLKAETLHGRMFNRGEDMETLPDGRVLFSETDTGRILVLDDRGEKPVVSTFLTHPDIEHPDNLEWDAHRQWLWITDDNHPSELWAWNGKQMMLIATEPRGEITGVEVSEQGRVYINLQGMHGGEDQTVQLSQ